jgi:hypothetical protein
MAKTHSILNFNEDNREHFALMVQALVQRHGQDPKDLFIHALESQAEAEMNYWTIMELVQNYFVSATAAVGEDAAGEPVKPLHAAVLMKNPGALAALLELKAYEGGVTDKDIQLAARMASQHEDQALLAILMKYAEQQGALEPFMRTLQNATVH